MNKQIKQEIKKIIKQNNFNCTVEEFQDKVNWYYISRYQKLSEKFIREFQDKVNWDDISYDQKLSEKFIIEFQDKVKWYDIFIFQKLSEKFIREFKDKVNWYYISRCQKLSEKFIREFQDEVDWHYISYYQKLSEKFIREFKDKVGTKLHDEINKKLTYKQKLKEVSRYCKKYNLEIDKTNKCFYAYRDHDFCGRGKFNKTIFYKKGQYYRDWHLDMREEVKNSFGLGIFPEGNTKVKVLIKDWGLECNREDGKCRVWGFEIV